MLIQQAMLRGTRALCSSPAKRNIRTLPKMGSLFNEGTRRRERPDWSPELVSLLLDFDQQRSLVCYKPGFFILNERRDLIQEDAVIQLLAQGTRHGQVVVVSRIDMHLWRQH